MNDRLLRGVHTALITPFTQEGYVDQAALKRLIDFQIENGIDGLVPAGPPGRALRSLTRSMIE